MIRFLIFSIFFSFCISKEYKAVDKLDLKSYTGKWLQVYENKFDMLFLGKSKCASANYNLINSNNVSVYNEQISLNNELESISGYAYYKNNDTGGYLTVRLDGQMEAPYWVIELGPIVDNLYDYAIVSDNLKMSLFVLVRDVKRFYKDYDIDVLKSLSEFGFTKIYNKPIRMSQINCNIKLN